MKVKHLQGGNSELGDDFGSKPQAANDCKRLKTMVIFTFMSVCSNTFESLQMDVHGCYSYTVNSIFRFVKPLKLQLKVIIFIAS